jgi:N-carbamoylputrescine amidase
MEPTLGAKQANVAKGLEWIGQAALNGACLIVLRGLASLGYFFRGRAEAFALAEEVPTGETAAASARRHDLYIVAGIAERAGSTLYNSTVVLRPSGYIGTFRKMHLWAAGNLFFEPGDLGFPARRLERIQSVLRDCRTDIYEETLGSEIKRG